MSAPSYRYITAHAMTGEILHWNLPLKNVEFGPELSGPGSLSATLEPGIGRPLAELLDPGNTVLYIERNGRLLWGGIVWRAEPQGAEYPVEAAGFGSYLHRRYDLHGNLDGRGPYIEADPAQIIRDVWAYAQEQPDGDLNVTVDDTESKGSVGTSKEPYDLPKEEARNLGEVVDEMADTDSGLEWSESVSWNGRRPRKRILLGAPRLGQRREDISFTTSINIATTARVVLNADEYAQAVVGLGAGEGRKRPRVVDAVRNGRLRLEHRLETREKDEDELAERVHRERRARQILPEMTELDVRDHPAAPLGSWHVGDDVRVRLHEQHTGGDHWCRITGWTVRPSQDQTPEQITLHLERTVKPEEAGEEEVRP